ncbi:MAG: DUF2628 domain-containing protein [Gammaproteobacteria bacterium]|nr:DUF2628 domain-containing protein [Gammaproteobacteria bacterium]
MNYTKNDRIISVANGFNIWAFIFAWGWLLSRGLWSHGLLVMLIYIPIYFFHTIVIASITSSMKLQELYYLTPTITLAAIHLYIGFKGNQWIRALLIRKGFEIIQ